MWSSFFDEEEQDVIVNDIRLALHNAISGLS